MKFLMAIASLLLPFASVGAQSDATNTPIPQISVASRGEVKVVPDRATIAPSAGIEAC